MDSILITGGAGFIGSQFMNLIISLNKYNNIIMLDKLDYCSRLANIESDNYKFIKGDILNNDLVLFILNEYKITEIVHFAACTHVDNSFDNSIEFTINNVLGTHNLIDCARQYGKINRFVHMSTDEVYGEISLDADKGYDENQVLDPSNPYSASKSAAEHIVKSYFHSYKFPVIIVRANNVYGPGQYPEKLIPKFCVYLLKNKKLTIHGEGKSRRNFIHVEDLCEAIYIILEKGSVGQVYNVSSSNEYDVIEIAQQLRNIICPENKLEDIIEYVEDRKFNDIRYFLNSEKLKSLGWKGETRDFNDSLIKVVEWYRDRLDEYSQI